MDYHQTTMAQDSVKFKPPKEGDPSVEGHYKLHDWLHFMEEFFIIKKLWSEGHVYTNAQLDQDVKAKYIIKNNLSVLYMEAVKNMPHAADMWRYLQQV